MKINLKNNTALKVLSLAIAIILWYIVGNIDDPVKTIVFSDIPVQIINGDVIKSNDKTFEIIEGDTVAVSVRGKTSVVNGLSKDDFTATADMSKLSIVNAVPIDVTASRNSNQLDISLGRVNTLKVTIEDRVEKMLPVVVMTEGTEADGYAIGSKTSSPNMVEVAGSESMIKRLKEIRVKVDVEGKKEDIYTRQSIAFYDQNGDEEQSPNIECDTVAVDVTIALWKEKEIPVNLTTVGKPAAGYGISAFDYDPKTITIAAEDDKLDSIYSLDLEVMDVSGQSESMEETISIDASDLPRGVILPEGTVDIVAKAVIEKKISGEAKLDASDITINGLAADKKVSFDKKSYTIKVESYESKIGNLTGASFEPYINISALKGEKTGKVRIHLVNPSGVTVTNTVDAEITIKDN